LFLSLSYFSYLLFPNLPCTCWKYVQAEDQFFYVAIFLVESPHELNTRTLAFSFEGRPSISRSTQTREVGSSHIPILYYNSFPAPGHLKVSLS
jgi:hypothetical protein